MEKLYFDSGVKEYQINDNGVLRFNPTDPNVYDRFFSGLEQVQEIEAKLTRKGAEVASEDGAAVVRLMAEADGEVKALLADIFGSQNDFNTLLGGVNLMAVGSNGERILSNFLMALKPIMQAGAEKCISASSDQAVAAAKAARAARK